MLHGASRIQSLYDFPTKLQSILSAPLLEKLKSSSSNLNWVTRRLFSTSDDEPYPADLGLLLSKIEENSPMSEYDVKTEKKLFSLQQIAFDTALKNLGSYKELIKSKISPPFRKELYEAAMKSVWRKTYEERYQIWTALPFLEPHRTVESINLEEFRWVMRKLEVQPCHWNGCDYDDDFDVPLDEVLRYLEQYAPNLRELFIDDPRPLHYQIISKTPQLGPISIDLIVQMKHLTKISIRSVTIHFSGFLRICKELENLQYVGAQGILVDVPVSNIKTLLATFNTAFDHQEYSERTFPTKFGIIFKKTEYVVHYREGNVKLDDLIFVNLLPELTHLRTYCGEEYQRHMMNFQHILSKVGGSLKRLTLSHFNNKSKLTFKNIFEHCRSLESLDLFSSYIADANEPINSFGKLREFCWDNSGPDHTISINSILHAPLLEKIEVKAYEFDLGDKE
ncbi:Hypothetical predicted protein [Cloeon dipterum]|uniref:Uncharacterized protein n=1 Tax=Cloeon dipterum TaxID=197152 RepID=A0A8S1DZK9_9INSE|nr:Hypothetical predicted protein [Cloeon dipterum]